MQNKAPQGNHDPIPTPERELERYGVWVKAEPQDIPEDQSIDRAPLDTTSADGSDAVLLSEEEELLDPFDFPDDDKLEATSDLPDEGSEVPDFSDSLELDETSGEDSILDIELEELESDEPAESISKVEIVAGDTDIEDFSTTEVSMDEFGFADDELVMEELSLESAEPEKGTGASDSSGQNPPSAGVDDFDSLDMDLQFDDTIPSLESGASSTDFDGTLETSSEFEAVDLDSIGLEAPDLQESVNIPSRTEVKLEETTLDSFIDDDEADSSGVFPEPAIENVSIHDSSPEFDDIKAVSDDLSSQAGDSSSDLLQKIALELSSIKEELVSLRSQLGSLKATGESSTRIEPQAVVDEDESVAGGFFDDEDDDTIALTGDELDNILNTADFTEEPGSDEELDEPESTNIELPSDIELLPEDGIYTSSTEAGIETIDLPVVDVDLGELNEIISNEGVTPLASQPEDTTFLDSDSGDAELELEGVPLEDVPLIEPDPSDLEIIIDDAFGTEEEDLPLIESASDGSEAEDLVSSGMEPEMILDLDANDDPVVSTVDSFPASMDEIEDALEIDDFSSTEDIGGLELLEESTPGSADDPAMTETAELEEELIIEDEPASPDHLQFHPDDVATSLDDSLFVDNSQSIDVQDTSSLEDVSAPVSAPELKLEPVPASGSQDVPDKLKHDVKSVLMYLDQLLASLPEEKIEEFASSEYYDTYKRLFDDLGLI